MSGKEKLILDSGCADGRFTLSIAPHFKKIIAIDLSKDMLNAAKKLQKDKGVSNVDFKYDVGFKIVFAQDYLYNEYYFSSADLDLFLQGVPIFEDYDSIKDSKLLKKYISQFQEKKGIRFPRHRVVIVAKKI